MDNLPSSAMGVMRLMPSKASEIAQFSNQIINSVKNGDANPLEVLVMLRSLEAVSELVREQIGEHTLTEAEKHAEKKFEAFGAFVEKAEVGVSYNFLPCKDPTYERLEVDFNTAKQRLDERKEFLKTLRSPTPIGDTVTGELVTVNPPIRKAKAGIKVFLK
jgi:hypothetical protein